MGHSVVVDCIGEDERGNLYTAMSKLEVYQMTIKYKIEHWYEQTDKGFKILSSFGYLPHGNIVIRDTILNNPPKGIMDCICKTSCPMCKGSGKTTKRMMNGWKSLEKDKRGYLQ